MVTWKYIKVPVQSLLFLSFKSNNYVVKIIKLSRPAHFRFQGGTLSVTDGRRTGRSTDEEQKSFCQILDAK